jgi:tetratricopeptide (TPR) repeat protein
VFLYHIRLDGTVLTSNQALSIEQSGAMREMAWHYSQLFEQRGPPEVTREKLQTLGDELFQTWFGETWYRLIRQLSPSGRRMLVIASDLPVILDLPWELLRPAGGDSMGVDAKWSIRRLPWSDQVLGAAGHELLPGPLRILYMVCAPRDQVELDFEREEELLLKALSRAGTSTGQQAVLDSCDLGTFEELGERIEAFRPHIVHLTGHGTVRDDAAFFAFEDERGETDLRPSTEVGQLFAGSGVQCAFLSGCQAAKAPPHTSLGGLAQGLLAEGVPLVVGWAASILDTVATQVAGRFYNAAAVGQPIDRALTLARQTVRKECERSGDPSWSLPVLYASTSQVRVFDEKAPAERTARPTEVQRPLPGMVEGYTPHFIGRRRELQRLLPGLRSGELQGILLTGLGGVGKSTMATRLARKLEAAGFTPVALSSSGRTPLTAALVLQIVGDALLHQAQEDSYNILRNAKLPLGDRLRAVVTGLNRGRFVLVLDNFESNLDEASHKILDGELAGFYQHALGHLAGGSRIIITSRYVPADVPELPPTMREYGLGEFSEASFLKFMLREEAVERRYRTGDLPHELLMRLHQVLGGTPSFLELMREVLKAVPAQELWDELTRVSIPAQSEMAPGLLEKKRDDCCAKIFTNRLYGRLDGASQKMLSRAAVYQVPVSLAGISAAAGIPDVAARTEVERWRRLALVHADDSTGRDLWSVYGLLRSWLLGPERLAVEERRAAHRAAGDFLMTLNQQDREAELGLGWVACLVEARAQYLAAGDYGSARSATDRISAVYNRQGLYGEVERLNDELLQYERHDDSLVWVAKSHLRRADFEAAKTWFQKIGAEIGTRPPAAEAAMMYGLGSVDLRTGKLDAARSKFKKALEIHRSIADRKAEAALAWPRETGIIREPGNCSLPPWPFTANLQIQKERLILFMRWLGLM